MCTVLINIISDQLSSLAQTCYHTSVLSAKRVEFRVDSSDQYSEEYGTNCHDQISISIGMLNFHNLAIAMSTRKLKLGIFTCRQIVLNPLTSPGPRSDILTLLAHPDLNPLSWPPP